MGRSWSLLLAQSIARRALISVDIPDASLVEDRRPAPVLRHKSDEFAAAYVDNVAVLGRDPDVVNQQLARVTQHLEQLGFIVHESQPAQTSCPFVGLEFDGIARTTRAKSSRVWRLRYVIEEALQRGHISGQMLEIIIGHATWIMLLRR
eukprot:2040702-Heterocapsa_arctica.AAC.1